jgi:high-affinity Fe2+/Pb2+ permease
MINIIKLKEENGEVTMNKEDFEGLIGEVESLIETVEILSDKNLMKQISGSEKDIKDGLLHEIKTTDDLRRLFLPYRSSRNSARNPTC